MNTRFCLGVASLCIGAALLISSAPARVVHAQGPSMSELHYTYVAEWAAPRDKWPAMEANFKESEATLKKLQADGVIVGWGWYSRLAHDESGVTHGDWFSTTSFDGIVRALDALTKTSAAPVLATAKHQDFVLRSLAHNDKPGASGTGILWVANYLVKPDHAEEFGGLMERVIVPALEKLLAEGAIASYEVDTQVVHSENPGIISVAYIAPNGAGVDKVQAAVRAATAADPKFAAAFEASTVGSAHRDFIARVGAYAHK